MGLLNPTQPVRLKAIEIDRAILEIQDALLFNLPWLSHGYSRAYRHVRKDNKLLYLPEVYMGTVDGVPDYHRVSPSDDKKGMCFFIVSNENQKTFNMHHFNVLSYEVGIVFWVNLENIDKPLLDTDYFVQNLVADVRNVITRKIHGSFFDFKINGVNFEFKDIYREFTLDDSENYLRAPRGGFRLNMTVQLHEDCNVAAYNRCDALTQNVTKDEVLNCLMPFYEILNGAEVLTRIEYIDENWLPIGVSVDGGLASNNSVAGVPLDRSAMMVHVNGRRQRVADASTTDEAFYFSGDGGITARSFDNSHPNGKVQQGDMLYCNPTKMGFNLTAGMELIINYASLNI